MVLMVYMVNHTTVVSQTIVYDTRYHGEVCAGVLTHSKPSALSILTHLPTEEAINHHYPLNELRILFRAELPDMRRRYQVVNKI